MGGNAGPGYEAGEKQYICLRHGIEISFWDVGFKSGDSKCRIAKDL